MYRSITALVVTAVAAQTPDEIPANDVEYSQATPEEIAAYQMALVAEDNDTVVPADDALDLAWRGGSCWKDAYGRGAGKVISTCAAGLEKAGALCYP